MDQPAYNHKIVETPSVNPEGPPEEPIVKGPEVPPEPPAPPQASPAPVKEAISPITPSKEAVHQKPLAPTAESPREITISDLEQNVHNVDQAKRLTDEIFPQKS